MLKTLFSTRLLLLKHSRSFSTANLTNNGSKSTKLYKVAGGTAVVGGVCGMLCYFINPSLFVSINDPNTSKTDNNNNNNNNKTAITSNNNKTTTIQPKSPSVEFATRAASLSTNNTKPEEIEIFAGQKKEGLPTYTREEISKHDAIGKGIWVTFREGVYDVTDFVDGHPGGTKILLAAGGSIEPFWNIYEQHRKKEVQDILESMRIGNVDAASLPSPAQSSANAAASDKYRGGGGMMLDTYNHEPERHKALNVISKRPFNAETPPEALESPLTPNELFFVRNHLAVPLVEENSYVLEVKIEGKESSCLLTLNDLRTKFPQYSITATVQCGGNRRQEMIATRWVQGIGWNIGAIGTATWTGPLMKDVLRYAGYNDHDEKLMHVQFEGLDCDSVCCYGASVPIDKVMQKQSGAVLAMSMNGQPLPRDHGYPVRAIVPGVVGSRNVKWLAKIIVSEEESQSFWQQRDYKLFSPSANYPTVDFNSAPSMQEMPVQSAIVSPLDGSVLPGAINTLTVKGYAWSGGGRSIARVDVSIDGGRFWHTAELKQPVEQKTGRAWAWSLWTAQIPIPPELRNQIEIVCKAVDSNYTSQPEHIDPIWNMRGLNNNAWHRIQVWLPRTKVLPPKPANAPPSMTPASVAGDKTTSSTSPASSSSTTTSPVTPNSNSKSSSPPKTK